MEVSSQAEKQHRCDGFTFDYGVFTNIGNDHIGAGEHASFAEYLSCKKKLLRTCRTGIVNRDDKRFPEIIRQSTCRLVTFGCREKADFMAADAALDQAPGVLGVSYRVQGAADFPGTGRSAGSVFRFQLACRHCGLRADGNPGKGDAGGTFRSPRPWAV